VGGASAENGWEGDKSMPKQKLKTHRGAAKRMSFTGTGKVKRMKAGKTHKLEVKTAKRKRFLRKATIATKQDAARARRMLPYA